jgi:hypothetical protein
MLLWCRQSDDRSGLYCDKAPLAVINPLLKASALLKILKQL